MRLILNRPRMKLVDHEGSLTPLTKLEAIQGEGENIELTITDEAGFTRTGLETFRFVVKPVGDWQADAHALATDFVWVPAVSRWQARVNYNTTLLNTLLKRGVSAPEAENDYIDLVAQFVFQTTSSATPWRSQAVAFRLHNAVWRGTETNPATGTPVEAAASPALTPIAVAITADQDNSAKAGTSTATTLQEITGLEFAVQSGVLYHFRAVIPYNSSGTTVGSRIVLTGPSTSFASLNHRSTLDASTVRTIEGMTALSLPASAGATSLTAGNLCLIEGIIKPSADGTVKVAFASETTTGTLTIKQGATLYRTQLTA